MVEKTDLRALDVRLEEISGLYWMRQRDESASPFSVSLDAMAVVESEIERRGLWREYLNALAEAFEKTEIPPNTEGVEATAWAMIRMMWLTVTAPAHVRARAAVRVLGGEA